MRVLRSDALLHIGLTTMVVAFIGFVIGAANGWSVFVNLCQLASSIGFLFLLAGLVAWGDRYWTLTRRRVTSRRSTHN
jgi:hypothetical protein